MNSLASSTSPGIPGHRLTDVLDHLDYIKRGLLTIARVTTNAKSDDASDAWWIGTKVLDEVNELYDLVDAAHESQRKPDPLISTQDDDGAGWIKATDEEADLFCHLRFLPESERKAIIADVVARPVPDSATS